MPAESAGQGAPAHATADHTVWLPYVSTEQTGPTATPIWPAAEATEGSVALFRHQFALTSVADEAELWIIADTRYEVWVDGDWVGRGPARFSRVRQESDAHSLGLLPPGEHTLAVLVQFAPNSRRSESSKPALLASLRGHDALGWRTVAATGRAWRAVLSPAWIAPAWPISQLNLIGPMEVLDLRQLPPAWMQPGYDDSAWPEAQPLEPSPFPVLSRRTIPALGDVVRAPVAVIEQGILSPGRRLIDLQHPTGTGLPVEYSLVVTATTPTNVIVESLEAGPVTVDGGRQLDWRPLDDPRRPDVLLARDSLTPGSHSLSISVPAPRPCSAGRVVDQTAGERLVSAEWACEFSSGRTIAVSLSGLNLPAGLGVSPVSDPGRRTLLADPVPGGQTAPVVQLFSDHADVYVPPDEQPRYLVLDFGRTIHARLSLQAEGPSGTVIDAGWDERLTEGRPLPNPGSLVSNLWSQVDSWILDGTVRQLRTLDVRAGRYLLLQVWGAGPVHLRQVHALEETYPVIQAGSFSSSDPLLDEVWQVGVDSLVPNMTDAYTDTPWRERGQWWGDAMISFHINRVAFGDLALFRRGLRQMADAMGADGRPAALAPNGAGELLLDFGMSWIEGMYDYWTLSGDLALMQELSPAASRLMAFLSSYEGPSGLLDLAPGHWSQTALVDWSAETSRSGESTALNAQYSAVLQQMGEIAASLGDSSQGQAYAAQAVAVRHTIHEILFLPHEGRYAASRLDGALVAASPHAQAWALRYGVVPVEHRKSVVKGLVGQLFPFFNEKGRSAVEPLGMFSVLEALGQVGASREALDLIREVYGDLLRRGATTW
jgi:alpha-L-rhamnosidase